MVRFWLDDGASISMSNSTVENSSDLGLQLVGDTSALRDFTGNTLTGNAKYGIELGPDHVGDLGMGTYGPNTIDGIHITSGDVTTDQTWASLGTPFVSDGFTVHTDAGSAHLTIAAGATVKMTGGTNVSVRDNGGLTLDGTASSPVTFTSAKGSPAAGDWNELNFYASSADGFNDLHHAVVEFGGGSSDGMILGRGRRFGRHQRHHRPELSRPGRRRAGPRRGARIHRQHADEQRPRRHRHRRQSRRGAR